MPNWRPFTGDLRLPEVSKYPPVNPPNLAGAPRSFLFLPMVESRSSKQAGGGYS